MQLRRSQPLPWLTQHQGQRQRNRPRLSARNAPRPISWCVLSVQVRRVSTSSMHTRAATATTTTSYTHSRQCTTEESPAVNHINSATNVRETATRFVYFLFTACVSILIQFGSLLCMHLVVDGLRWSSALLLLAVPNMVHLNWMISQEEMHCVPNNLSTRTRTAKAA